MGDGWGSSDAGGARRSGWGSSPRTQRGGWGSGKSLIQIEQEAKIRQITKLIEARKFEEARQKLTAYSSFFTATQRTQITKAIKKGEIQFKLEQILARDDANRFRDALAFIETNSSLFSTEEKDKLIQYVNTRRVFRIYAQGDYASAQAIFDKNIDTIRKFLTPRPPEGKTEAPPLTDGFRVMVKIEGELTDLYIEKITEFAVFEVAAQEGSDKKQITLFTEPARLLEIATLLHNTQVNGAPYLQLAPEEAVKPQHYQELVRAMLNFYLANSKELDSNQQSEDIDPRISLMMQRREMLGSDTGSDLQLSALINFAVDDKYISLLKVKHQASIGTKEERLSQRLLENRLALETRRAAPGKDVILLMLHYLSSKNLISTELRDKLIQAFKSGSEITPDEMAEFVVALEKATKEIDLTNPSAMQNLRAEIIALSENVKSSDISLFYTSSKVYCTSTECVVDLVRKIADGIESESQQARLHLREFSPLQTADFGRLSPFAAFKSSFALTTDPTTIQDAITVSDLVRLEHMLYPFDASGYDKPYLHFTLSSVDKTILTQAAAPDGTGLYMHLRALGTLGEGLIEKLNLLTTLTKDPTKPDNVDSRIIFDDIEIDMLRSFMNDRSQAGEEIEKQKQLIGRILIGFYRDPGSEEDALAIRGLREAMAAEGIRILTPDNDYYSLRSMVTTDTGVGIHSAENYQKYTKGMEVLKRLVTGSRAGLRVGSGRVVQGDSFSERYADLDPRDMAVMILQQSINSPSRSTIGVMGAEEWKIIHLKTIYLREKGMLVNWKALKTQLDTKREEIREILASDRSEADMKRDLQTALDEYDQINAELNAYLNSLKVVDREFVDWLIERYVGGRSDWQDQVLDWVNVTFFDVEGFQDPFSGKKVSLGELSDYIILSREDAELNYTGWRSLNPQEGDPSSAIAKQALSLFISYIPMDGEASGEVNPALRSIEMYTDAMQTGRGPKYIAGADIKSYVFMLEENPQVRRELILDNATLKPEEVNRQIVEKFATLFERMCVVTGKQEQYAPTIRALKDIAAGMGADEILLINDRNLTPETKKLISALFILNILMLDMQGIKQSSGNVRVLNGGEDGRVGVLGGLGGDTNIQETDFWTSYVSPMLEGTGPLGLIPGFNEDFFDRRLDPEKDWTQHLETDMSRFLRTGEIEDEAMRGLANVGAGALDMPYELTKALLIFGPFMGTQFSYVLPRNFAYNIHGWATGKEVMDVDPEGNIRVDAEGNIKFREMGFTDIAKSGGQLAMMIFMFRNWAPMFYSMLRIHDDIADGNYLQAYIKYAIATFFMLQSSKGFFESTMGRTISVDRYLFKILRSLNRASAKIGGQEWYSRFCQENPKFKFLVDNVERLGEHGIAGEIARGIGSSQTFMRGMMWASQSESPMAKGLRGVGVGARITFNPIGSSMRGAASLSELSGEGRLKGVARATGKAYGGALGGLFTVTTQYLNPWWYVNPFGLEGKVYEWGITATHWAKVRYWEGGLLGDATAASRETARRRAGESTDLVGNLNPDEFVFDINARGRAVPMVGDKGVRVGEQFDIAEDSSALAETRMIDLYRGFSERFLLHLNDGRMAVKIQESATGEPKTYNLRVTRVVVDSYLAQSSRGGMEYVITKPSMIAPNSECEVEIHVSRQFVAANYSEQGMIDQVRSLQERASLTSIDNPAFKLSTSAYTFERVKQVLESRGIKVNLDATAQAEIEGRFFEEGVLRLADFLERRLVEVNGEKTLDTRTWLEEIKYEFADELIDKPRSTHELEDKTIHRAAEALVESVAGAEGDYRIVRQGDRSVIEITERGMSSLWELAEIEFGKGNFTFIEVNSIARKAALYIEAHRFAAEVTSDALVEITNAQGETTKIKAWKLVTLTDAQGRQRVIDVTQLEDSELERILERQWEIRERTHIDNVNAAKLHREITKRVLGYRATRVQVLAGYAGALATRGSLKMGIEQGTGEGKTLVLSMDSFLRLLSGLKINIVTSTTETNSQSDFREYQEVYRRLGIQSHYIPNEGMSDVIQGNLFERGMARGRMVIYSTFDTVRFRGLFDLLSMDPRRMVLPTDLERVGVSLDEGDHSVIDQRPSPAQVTSDVGSSVSAKEDGRIRKAADVIQELVKLGWLTKTGQVTEKGRRFINNETSEEYIRFSEEGYQYIRDNILSRDRAGRIYVEGDRIIPEMQQALKTALHVKRFVPQGEQFEIRRTGVSGRPYYVYRDPSTGVVHEQMQFDANVHKAVIAQIGAETGRLYGVGRVVITEPGVSSASITVPETMEGFGAQSITSGTLRTASTLLAQDGFTLLSVETGFPRTRVEHPAIVVKGQEAHTRLVVDQAITSFLEGKPVLIHLAVNQADEGRNLSIQEVREALIQRLRQIQANPADPLHQKLLTLQETIRQANAASPDRAAAWGRRPIDSVESFVQVLTDTGSFAEKVAIIKRIGFRGLITLSDIANRATDPGRESSRAEVDKLFREHFHAEAGVEMTSIVTQMKRTVRDFIQEINRICRPNQATGLRDPGSSYIIYNIDDPNLSGKFPEVHSYLKMLLAEKAALVVRGEDLPASMFDPDKAAERSALWSQDAEYLERVGALNAEEARVYRETGKLPADCEAAIRLYEDFQVRSDFDVTQTAFDQYKPNEAMQFLREMNMRIKRIAVDPTLSFAEILNPAMESLVNRLAEQYGIRDDVPRSQWKVRQFKAEFEKLTGITLSINEADFKSAWSLRDSIIEAFKQRYAAFESSPESPVIKQKIAQIMLEKVQLLMDNLTGIEAQLRSRIKVAVTPDGLTETAIIERLLPDHVRDLFNFDIARGPEGIIPRQRGIIERGRHVYRAVRGTRRWGNLGTYFINASTLTVTPPRLTDIAAIERDISKKLRAVDGRAIPANPSEGVLTITIGDGETFKLYDAADVARLNARLEQIGSSKRLYVSRTGSGLHFIVAEADAIRVDSANYRVIVMRNETAATTSDKSLAFVPVEQSSLFGAEPRYEIIIRADKIVELYDYTLKAAFDPHTADANPREAALARQMFRELGITTRAQAEAQKARVLDLICDDIQAHEVGHVENILDKLPTQRAEFRYLRAGFLESLYELMADFHPEGRLGRLLKLASGEGKPAAEARALLYEYMIEEGRHHGSGPKSVFKLIYETCLDARGQIDVAKLSTIRERLYAKMTGDFTRTISVLDGMAEANPRMSEIELRALQDSHVARVEANFASEVEAIRIEEPRPESKPVREAPPEETRRPRPLRRPAPRAEGRPAVPPPLPPEVAVAARRVVRKAVDVVDGAERLIDRLPGHGPSVSEQVTSMQESLRTQGKVIDLASIVDQLPVTGRSSQTELKQTLETIRAEGGLQSLLFSPNVDMTDPTNREFVMEKVRGFANQGGVVLVIRMSNGKPMVIHIDSASLEYNSQNKTYKLSHEGQVYEFTLGRLAIYAHKLTTMGKASRFTPVDTSQSRMEMARPTDGEGREPAKPSDRPTLDTRGPQVDTSFEPGIEAERAAEPVVEKPTRARVTSRMELSRRHYLMSGKVFAEQMSGVDLRGKTPEVVQREFDWILGNSTNLQAIMDKYKIDMETARKLVTSIEYVTHEHSIVNAGIDYDAETGRIIIELSDGSRKTFTDVTEAERFVKGKIRTGEIAVKRESRLLNIERGGAADAMVGSVGMGVTGFIAEGLVGILFESIETIWPDEGDEGHQFNWEHIGSKSIHGGLGWTMMGLKMHFAEMATGSGKIGFGYGIVLPMLNQATSVSEADGSYRSYERRTIDIFGGAAGFGGFLAGERITMKLLTRRAATRSALAGARPNWMARVGGATAGVFVAELVRRGLETEWAHENIWSEMSWENQKILVDSVDFFTDRLEGYITGQIVGGLASFGAKLLLGFETGGAGWLFAATGAIGDGITGGVGRLLIGGEAWDYETYGNKLLEEAIDGWYAGRPWYRVDQHFGGLVRGINFAFYGSNLMGMMEADDGVMGGNWTWTYTNGTKVPWKDHLCKMKATEFKRYIDYFVSGIMLKHITGVSYENGEVKFEFDQAAIDSELAGNKEIQWMLGFIQHHSSSGTWEVYSSFNDISKRPVGGSEAYQFGSTRAIQNSFAQYRKTNLQIPIENGTKTIGFGDIIQGEVDKINRERVEEARRILDQVGDIGGSVKKRLASLWFSLEPRSIDSYDGRAGNVDFFNVVNLPSDNLVGLMSRPIVFQQDVAIRDHVVIEMTGLPRERDAYDFVMENSGSISQEALLFNLTELYHILDPETFMLRVMAYNLQQDIQGVFRLKAIEDEAGVPDSANAKIREIFNANGTIKAGHGDDLVEIMFEQHDVDIWRAAISEDRKLLRMGALIEGARPNESDKFFGFVSASGRVNTRNPYYVMYWQIMERTYTAEIAHESRP